MNDISKIIDLFGTAGIRRKIGPGINEINVEFIYRIVSAATNFLIAQGKNKKKSILICRDNRRFSYEFALAAAKAVADHGFEPFFISDIMPSPFLSYGTKKTNCALGIMITASHNPKEDNGIKLFSEDGTLLLGDACENISRIYFEKYAQANVPSLNFEKLVIEFTDHDREKELIDKYTEELVILGEKWGLTREKIKESQISVGFSPQHGTGYKIVPAVLKKLGVNYLSEPVQSKPDPDFSGTPNPNPAEPSAFRRLRQLGNRNDLDILLSTDPDADRLAVAVRHKGKIRLLSGNETAIIMFGFLLDHLEGKEKRWAAGSLVSTSTIMRMAIANNVDYYETNTGFKWISYLVSKVTDGKFLLGFEESLGYLASTTVAHDKDGIQSLILIIAIAVNLEQKAMTLVDFLNQLTLKYGKEKNLQMVLTHSALNYKTAIGAIAKMFAATKAPLEIIRIDDFADNKILYLKSNTGKITFSDGSRLMVRPSGTENGKLRFYLSICGPNMKNKLTAMKNAVSKLSSM